MSKTVNKVELLGRVGTDPELRYAQSGTAVARLRLATDRGARQNGESETDWHDIVCWGKLAEAVNQYVGKVSAYDVNGDAVTYSISGGEQCWEVWDRREYWGDHGCWIVGIGCGGEYVHVDGRGVGRSKRYDECDGGCEGECADVS